MKKKQPVILCGMVTVALIFGACGSDSGNNSSESEGDSSSSIQSSSSSGPLSSSSGLSSSSVPLSSSHGVLSSSSLVVSSSSVTLQSSSSVPLSSSIGGSSSSSSIEDGTLTYEGQTYKTVVIGTQTWMAENLNYEVDSSWCYNDSAKYCEKYGRLYQWASAMGLSATYNSTSASGVISTPQQGVCPAGWHIPTNAEWTILENAVGGEDVAGTALKSTSGWNEDGNGTDAYGFSARPAGGRNGGGYFYGVGDNAYFWSATEGGTVSAYGWYLYYSSAFVWTSSNRKGNAFSVRCLKD